ncbi:MAG: DNA-3-methyladenine glycosylase I [Armatimonadetes bacterium]|nr:DNA-3-methyladenine glycosylase I [Armatimonadota bacterium]
MRCQWAESTPEEALYHDQEWGRPVSDRTLLFEMFTLEGAQAGLSWATVLRKRDGYRKVFHNFEIERVATMTDQEVASALLDPGIVRNRSKVRSTVENAQCILQLEAKGTPWAEYLWSFVGGKPINSQRASLNEIPAESDQSKAMSKSLKKLGFRFCGPTICYAFMQAVGMVNDHVVTCDHWQICADMAGTFSPREQS